MDTALILSGGPPVLTLMAGAMYAFEEKKVKFDVISTSGPGTAVGLIACAPKGMNAMQALKSLVNLGVHDWIYGLFPVNYKIFEKPGFWADIYRQFLQSIPWLESIENPQSSNIGKRLFSDWMQLLFSSFCPANIVPLSKGLCNHAPFISKLVDFEKLKNIKPEFYINAYNITDHRMETFSKKEINIDHFHASMSFPFIYPPYEMNGKLYYEGAAKDCLNFKSLLKRHPEIKKIVIFDVMNIDRWIREPLNLYDAWVLSIIIPLVAVSKDDVRIFELKYNTGPDRREILKVLFDIPDERLPNILDWSYSNLETMFEIGYKSGIAFCNVNGAELGL